MTLVAQDVPDGTRIVDSSTRLTVASAAAIAAHVDPDGGRIGGVCRYIPFAGHVVGNDLTAEEGAIITGAGLALLVVQHVRFGQTPTQTGWHPTSTMGSADGLAAVSACRSADMPAGLSVVYDMEGPSAATTAQDCADYDHAWCDVVGSAGYLPCAYLGYGLPMSAEQEYMLKVVRYWKSGSYVVEPAEVGWAMVQDPRFDVMVGGVAVDRDMAQADKKGRRMVWAIAA